MPWEELAPRARPDVRRTTWAMSINKNGITIRVPAASPFARVPCVVTQLGTGTDAGYVRLLPAKEGGRKVQGSKVRIIRYSTLPGAPAALSITELDITTETSDTVVFRLPWATPTAVERAVAPLRAPPFKARSSREAELEAQAEFAARKGVTTVMTPEQVAQFLRDCGERATVRIPPPPNALRRTKSSVQEKPVFKLNDYEVDIVEFYGRANELRARVHLPAVKVPA